MKRHASVSPQFFGKPGLPCESQGNASRYAIFPIRPTNEKSKMGDKFNIRFKAVLSLREDMFDRVDSAQVFKTAGWDEAAFNKEYATLLTRLPAEDQPKLIASRPKQAEDIVFLERVTGQAEQGYWHGTADCTYRSNRWNCINLISDSQTKFRGKPKASFGDGAIILGTDGGVHSLDALLAEREKYLAQLQISAGFGKGASSVRQHAKNGILKNDSEEESARRIARCASTTDQTVSSARRLPCIPEHSGL